MDDRIAGNEPLLNLPFTGIPTFLRAPLQSDLSRVEARVGILGLPSDEGTGAFPGCRYGPRSIREASLRFSGYGPRRSRHGYYDIDEDRWILSEELAHGHIADCGDVDIVYTRPADTFSNITSCVTALLKQDVFPVLLGGDHAVSSPVVRGFTEPLAVVQFDAHMDYLPPEHGVEHSNGNPMRLIAAQSNVARIIHAGIRGLKNGAEDVEDSRADGNVVISSREFRRQGVAQILDAVPPNVGVYVTIDVDVFDAPLVPGCGGPEVDGPSYQEVAAALFELAEETRIVGFDVVEVNPMLDTPVKSTALLAAQLAVEFLGHIVASPHHRTAPGSRQPGDPSEGRSE